MANTPTPQEQLDAAAKKAQELGASAAADYLRRGGSGSNGGNR